MAEIEKILRAKKVMADQESLVFMQPKPEKKKEAPRIDQVKRKSYDIPDGGHPAGLNEVGEDITLAEYVAKKDMERTQTSNVDTNRVGTQIDEETFYLLLYRPSGQESETTCFHPLFEMYEHLLNDVLPEFENVNTDKECWRWMEGHLGILTQEW